MTESSAAAPHSSRREFLTAGAALTPIGVAAVLGSDLCAERQAAGARDGGASAGPSTAADALDAAYERLAARFPDANIHAANHAPMVVEALSVLGRPGAIAPWLD